MKYTHYDMIRKSTQIKATLKRLKEAKTRPSDLLEVTESLWTQWVSDAISTMRYLRRSDTREDNGRHTGPA